jgi:hypothetical protein
MSEDMPKEIWASNNGSVKVDPADVYKQLEKE